MKRDYRRLPDSFCSRIRATIFRDCGKAGAHFVAEQVFLMGDEPLVRKPFCKAAFPLQRPFCKAQVVLYYKICFHDPTP